MMIKVESRDDEIFILHIIVFRDKTSYEFKNVYCYLLIISFCRLFLTGIQFLYNIYSIDGLNRFYIMQITK